MFKAVLISFLRQSSLVSAEVTGAIKNFLNDMRCINPRVTYFTYLVTAYLHDIIRITVKTQ